MPRIDAHQHFWNFNPARDSWITDDMQVIRRDFLPEDLFPELQHAGIDGCIAVQAAQSEEETVFLVQCAKDYSFVRGVVGWVNLVAENVAERLEYFSSMKQVKGFRHVLQGEADRAFMLRTDFKRGIASLKDFGFTYDVLIHNDQLPYVIPFVAAFPDQKFVIDHLAKPSIKTGKLENWKKAMVTLAQYPNVWCKVSGMTTEADWKGWSPKDFHPYLDVVTEAFGTKRLMFGSDWPVCLLAGTFAQTVSIVADYFRTFSQPEKEAFFGGNAGSFYNI